MYLVIFDSIYVGWWIGETENMTTKWNRSIERKVEQERGDEIVLDYSKTGKKEYYGGGWVKGGIGGGGGNAGVIGGFSVAGEG